MTNFAKKFWTTTYISGCLAIVVVHVLLAGCVEVGGGSSSGTATNDADGGSSTQTQTQAEE